MTPFIEGLFTNLNPSMPSLNKGLVSHALPCILKLYPEALKSLLDQVSQQYTESMIHRDLVMRALLCILKIGRKQRLFSSMELEHIMQRSSLLSSETLISTALLHEKEDICLDALELLCQSAKETEEPSQFEIKMIKLFMANNMKSSHSNFRQTTVIKLGKFLQRLKDVVRKVAKPASKTTEKSSIMLQLVHWMVETIFSSLYPGVPYAREQLALQVYTIPTTSHLRSSSSSAS